MSGAARSWRRCSLQLAGLLVLGLCAAVPAGAQELLTNGDFETGDFTGWTVTDLAGSSGSWFIGAPGTTSPVSGFATAGNPGGGTFYAVTDQIGPGTHALTQTFTVPGPAASVILSFEMFANDQSGLGPIVDPIGLDHTAPANQHARVDILTAAAGPFDTGAGVVANYYVGVDGPMLPNPYTPYTIDITADVGAGGTYQIRFAEVDNQYFFQNGVDNVSVQFTAGAPTAGVWALVLLGMLLLLIGVSTLMRREKSGNEALGA